MYYILFYDYVPDILERRTSVRPGHLAHATSWLESGRLLLAGAYTDPLDGAAFIFRGVSRADVEAFVANDPYVLTGLVPAHHIREWNVVIANP